MSANRYVPPDLVKEPHTVSLKVLRLSKPSLATQQPLRLGSTVSDHDEGKQAKILPASLAYPGSPSPFLLSPILTLPPSFNTVYVGETFSCTLCANNQLPNQDDAISSSRPLDNQPLNHQIKDVRIEAEIKIPSSSIPHKLVLLSSGSGTGTATTSTTTSTTSTTTSGTDLFPAQTLQRTLTYDLKEEGIHVLGITISYYEASATSGRTRTFRKLYQFVCKNAIVVRTKTSLFSTFSSSSSSPSPPLQISPSSPRSRSSSSSSSSPHIPSPTEQPRRGGGSDRDRDRERQRWVLEAQLENISEDTIVLDSVVPILEPGLVFRDCNNWTTTTSSSSSSTGRQTRTKPVIGVGEVEQVCFIITEIKQQQDLKQRESDIKRTRAPQQQQRQQQQQHNDGRVLFGTLGIEWRSEMGKKGYITTSQLGARLSG